MTTFPHGIILGGSSLVFLHMLAARDGIFLGGTNSDGILLCKDALGSYSLLAKQAKPQRVFICNILCRDLISFMGKTENRGGGIG